MADIVIVVNSAGLQERRAQELALRTQHHRVSDIVVAPSPDRLRRALRSADVVYVIDAGRAGASAFAAARAMRRACTCSDPPAASSPPSSR